MAERLCLLWKTVSTWRALGVSEQTPLIVNDTVCGQNKVRMTKASGLTLILGCLNYDGSDVVQAFRLIGNWDVASKGWSTGVSGSLVAEAELQIMMVLDHLFE